MPQYAKYIIPKSTRAPIIFSPAYEHKEMAHPFGQCISAGFVKITVGPDDKISVNCFGESISLDLKSRPTIDAQLIKGMVEREF